MILTPVLGGLIRFQRIPARLSGSDSICFVGSRDFNPASSLFRATH